MFEKSIITFVRYSLNFSVPFLLFAVYQEYSWHDGRNFIPEVSFIQKFYLAFMLFFLNLYETHQLSVSDWILGFHFSLTFWLWYCFVPLQRTGTCTCILGTMADWFNIEIPNRYILAGVQLICFTVYSVLWELSPLQSCSIINWRNNFFRPTKEGYFSVNDSLGFITLEKNGKCLDLLARRVSSDRISAIEVISKSVN